MGQTLTHGVYLPSEGERNCYNGLASNWRLLDGAIGTVAAHTTAIAGKASASHTHGNITNDGKVGTTANLPLITGTGGAITAGAFGTSANTFCEGNDSRLSDARTPLSHTHTKSDVTDLLNSNFIPGANNSYDLGSSSYQWSSVYAQTYYYNGTAWGLDKYNQWTGINNFNNLIGLNNAELWFKHPNIEDITTNPSTDTGKSILQIWNKGTTQYFGGIIDRLTTDGSHILELVCFGYPLNDTTPYQHRFRFAAHRNGGADFYPSYNGVVNLGTSSNKWKTLNGINPGALSLPNINYTEGDPDVYNVGTDLNDLTKNVSDPLHFSWTSPFDGWLAIMWYLRDITPPYNVLVTSHSEARFSKFSQTWSASSARWYLATTFPVVKNVTYYFDIDFQNTTIGVVHHAYLLPCLGNV